jgi:hypothetical protein
MVQIFLPYRLYLYSIPQAAGNFEILEIFQNLLKNRSFAKNLDRIFCGRK